MKNLKFPFLVLLLNALVSFMCFSQVPVEYFPVAGRGNTAYMPSGTASAGSAYLNLEKYWYYRYRLVNDFMLIGDGAGESLPADFRDRKDRGVSLTSDQFARFVPTRRNLSNILNFSSDNTLALGHYLSTLALEYKQLLDNGQSTTRTLFEIQHAQNALKRLCSNSSYYESASSVGGLAAYPGYATSSLCTTCTGFGRGFFLRDDVPLLTFTDPAYNPSNYKHFNRSGLADPVNEFEVNIANGGFKNSYYGTDPRNYAAPPISPPTFSGWHVPECESQDQLAEVFTGEALLLKYLTGPEPITPILHGDAQEGVFKLIDWPRHFYTSCHIPYYSIPDVITPCLCAKNNCSSSGLLFPTSPAATAAADGMLRHTGYSLTMTGDRISASSIINITVFQYMQLLNATCTPSHGLRDIPFTDAYVAFSKSWTALLPFPAVLSFVMGYRAATASWNAIRNHSVDDFFGTPHNALIYQLNFGDQRWNRNIDLQQMLDAAPCCGTYNYERANDIDTRDRFWDVTGSAYPAPTTLAHNTLAISEWSGNDRVAEPYHRQGMLCYAANGDNMQYASEFNGLDYMMLFNLFAYQRGTAGSVYLNGLNNPYYCEDYRVDYPDNNGMGSSSSRLKLNFLEYLSAVNKVHASGNGWVEYRAAKVIDLKPGFEAEYGSKFNGYVKDYTCHGGVDLSNPYHFATVFVPSFSYKTANSDTTKDGNDSVGKDVPIEYYPNGHQYRAELVPSEDTPTIDDITFDSLMSDSNYINPIKARLRCEIVNNADPDVLEQLKSYLNLTDEEIALCRNQAEGEEISVAIMPDPATDEAFIVYELKGNAQVAITVTNSLGQNIPSVVEPFNPDQQAGKYKLTLNTVSLQSGIYFVTVRINNQIITKKLVKI